MELLHLSEKRLAEAYEQRFGHPNPFRTMDAGLGGKMELHCVELYSVNDFDWMDAVIRSILPDPRRAPRPFPKQVVGPAPSTDSPLAHSVQQKDPTAPPGGAAVLAQREKEKEKEKESDKQKHQH